MAAVGRNVQFGLVEKLIALGFVYAFFSLSALGMTFFGSSASQPSAVVGARPKAGGGAVPRASGSRNGDERGATGQVATFVWLTNETAARDLARRDGRPMIIDFTAEWCGACREMQKTTYLDGAFLSAAKRFVGLRVDGTDEDDVTFAKLSSRYGVQGLPAIVLLDASGGLAKIFKRKPTTSDLSSAMEAVH